VAPPLGVSRTCQYVKDPRGAGSTGGDVTWWWIGLPRGRSRGHCNGETPSVASKRLHFCAVETNIYPDLGSCCTTSPPTLTDLRAIDLSPCRKAEQSYKSRAQASVSLCALSPRHALYRYWAGGAPAFLQTSQSHRHQIGQVYGGVTTLCLERRQGWLNLTAGSSGMS
jgi:hypothetical protein